ncbi:hypothetical protein BC941DRAFT_423305 [Chlamydoabsidia padenii]|nr:hypothetical protein BC941DRAFT_423305 [Chlamydoabsidia padenii]
MNPTTKRKRPDSTKELYKKQKLVKDPTKGSQPTLTCSDDLTLTLVALRNKTVMLNEQMARLENFHNHISCFNNSFGAFLFGMAANNTTAQWRTDSFRAQDTPPTPADNTNLSQEDSHQVEEISLPSTNDNVPPKEKVLKFVTKKINIGTIVDGLPLKYREKTEYRKAVETVLRDLRLKPEGMSMNSMMERTGLPKHRVTDCLNALIRIKDVLKVNPKGQMAIYRMNPTKYPSA